MKTYRITLHHERKTVWEWLKKANRKVIEVQAARYNRPLLFQDMYTFVDDKGQIVYEVYYFHVFSIQEVHHG